MEAKDMNSAEKTGNRKCWHVVNEAGQNMGGGLTVRQAKNIERIYNRTQRACRDGYKLIPCTGPAHSNAHIDNCMDCAPRWGWVMVKEGV
jgi:hypothetical protein